MKLRIVLLILFLALPCMARTAGTSNDTLKTLTINVYGSPDSDWPIRQTLLLNEMAVDLPDLIGLQEIIEPGGGNDVRAKALADSLFLRTGIHYNYIYERTHFSFDTWFEGIAVLTPHIILDSEAMPLPPGLFTRAVIWTRVLTPAGIVNFFNTHLSFGNQEETRETQVEAVRDFIAAKSADGVAIANIVCGDFNAIPDSPPIQRMTNPMAGNSYIDSWEVANPGQPGLTMPSDNPNARIDYVFSRDDDEVTVLTSRLAFSEANNDGIYPSDHIGVLSTLASTSDKIAINILSPMPGQQVAGVTNVSWEFDPVFEAATTMLYVSPDGGATWQQEFSVDSAVTSYDWNSLLTPDGTRYLLRVVAIGDSSFGMGETQGIFTVNNPGNAAPELMLSAPRTGEVVSGLYEIKWHVADTEDDSLSGVIEVSSDGGTSWQELNVDDITTGSFFWDTFNYPNTPFYQLRISVSDGESEVSENSGTFTVENERAALPGTHFEQIAGSGDGFVTGSIVDSTQLTGHLYRITFDDTSFANTTYDVFDVDEDVPVVSQATELDGKTEGPMFDGMRLIVFDLGSAAVDDNNTGWTQGASTLEFNISTPTVLVGGGQVQSIPWPADYRISLSDMVVDSSSNAFGLPVKPMKFEVWNLTEDRKSDVLYIDPDNNQTISALDQIIILETDKQDELRLTWNISFQSTSSSVDPVPGDEFTLATLKPFTSQDIFEFRGALPTSIAGTQELPQSLVLLPNYPNPFNPETSITYILPDAGDVRLSVYNMLGQEIRILVDGRQVAGTHRVKWDGRNHSGTAVASGVYIYRIKTAQSSISRKMLLLR